MECSKAMEKSVSEDAKNEGMVNNGKSEFDENQFFEHINQAYDASPTSQKLLFADEGVHSNTLHIDTNLITMSRDSSSQLLSVSDSKRPSSIASSHLHLESNGYDVDDHVISILSYGAYGALLLVLAILTTIFLLCFG